MRLLERRGFLTGFATLTLFTVLAGDAWRNSISWYGFGALAAILSALSVAVLVRHRSSIRPGSLPWPLVAFLALATVSIAWSFYPGASAIGVVSQVITTLAAVAIALVLTGDEVLRALGWALRTILVLSLVFELAVSLVVRAPVLPVWVNAADRVDPPLMLYWSRNLLLEGDRIQGIVGNSGLLGMIALIALIVFGVQLAAGTVRRLPGMLWLVLAAAVLALTRSATITVALVAVLLVLGMILALRRAGSPRARLAVSGAVVVVLAGVAGSALAFRPVLLGVLGKSDDLTGRLDMSCRLASATSECVASISITT